MRTDTSVDPPSPASGARERRVTEALVTLHGKRYAADIARGVGACARVWSFEAEGGEAFASFCREQYVPPGSGRAELLARLDEFHGAVAGSMGAAYKVARAGQDMADRPDLPAERVIGAFTPSTHLSEDYRAFHVAPLIQLNFGTDDRKPPRTRAGWAARRFSDVGREVVPSESLRRYSLAQSEVDRFVSSYNLHLDRIEFPDPRVRFPKNTRLISHWGLRDYMMSLNGTKDALPKQRAILELMRRVVDGEVPERVLDDPSVTWDLAGGRVKNRGRWSTADGHGALRWERFRKVWLANLEIDPHTRYGNLIDNKFLGSREMPEKDVVGILTQILSSPLAPRVARLIRDRLGRDLEPFDVYFQDFASGRSKPKLRYDIRKRYPDAAALQKALPGFLEKLGWKRRRARWLASMIRVDNSRASGHAWPPAAPHDPQLLRVRIEPSGVDEIAFDTFMHELGHAVEGVVSSYEMDYRALWGVPGTAFSEGFAFTFQDRADEVLGRPRAAARRGANGSDTRDVETLVRFWEPYEIAGPALTEIRFFHWLYEHPSASADEMQHAVRRIGDEVWTEFYARIFGDDGHGLMSVYSHMLWCDFYLADYPMGYVIAYQVRKHLGRKQLARETERMCRTGSIYPQSWMKNAVGSNVSVKPLLADTRAALSRLGY